MTVSCTGCIHDWPDRLCRSWHRFARRSGSAFRQIQRTLPGTTHPIGIPATEIEVIHGNGVGLQLKERIRLRGIGGQCLIDACTGGGLRLGTVDGAVSSISFLILFGLRIGFRLAFTTNRADEEAMKRTKTAAKPVVTVQS